MQGVSARSRRRRGLLGAAIVGSAVVVAAGCTNPGGGFPWRTTTTWQAPPSTDGHGHTDDDHANKTSTTMDMDHGGGGADDHSGGGGGHAGHESPARLNHPPTAAQKAWAYKLVRDTAARLQGMTKAKAQALGYQNIRDNQHFTNPRFRNDGKEYDPTAIESLVFNIVTGQIEAAMYNLEPTTTMANVKDYAGNWLVYHNHDNLCWPRNQPDKWQITPCGMGEKRTPVLMAHVWIKDTRDANRCGVFATIQGLGEGSCIPALKPSVILSGRNPV
jgi:hypothetical protein